MKSKQKNAIKFIVNNMIIVEKLTDALGVPKGMSFKKRAKIVDRVLHHLVKNTTITKGGKLDKKKDSIVDELDLEGGGENEDFKSMDDIAAFLYNK